MTAPDTLLLLATKCEEATEGSRELDFWVAVHTGTSIAPHTADEIATATYTSNGEFEVTFTRTKGKGFFGNHCIPYVTFSLDAAVGLCERVLPKGVQWTVSNSRGINDYTAAALIWVPKKTFEIDGKAKTPALALTAAILRAAAAKGSADT